MPTPLRCLHILNSREVGGGNKSMLLLSNAMRHLGWTSVAVLPETGPITAHIDRAALPYVIYDYSQPSIRHPLASLRNHMRWSRILARTQPQLIHANSILGARSIMTAAKIHALPVVCHIRMTLDPGLIRWAFRHLPQPATFLFNSRQLHDSVWPLLSIHAPRSKAFVVPNAVDTTIFCPARTPQPRACRVGILANLMRLKGHEDFLMMASHVLRIRPDVEFWIIGSDIHGEGRLPQLERLARRLGVHTRTRFLGQRNDVPTLLRGLAVLVCASYVEAFGRSLIEAMASGVPVVATRVGGIPEVVKDQHTGFLVEPGDHNAMAQCVLSLLDDPARWSSMSRAARTHAVHSFSSDAHATAIDSVYRELLTV